MFAGLVHELEGIEPFVRSQVALGANEDELRNAQAQTIKLKIDNLPNLALPSATALTLAIANVRWSQDIKLSLGDSVRQSVARYGSAMAGGGKPPARGQQSCANVELFLKSKHWEPIADVNTPWSVRIHTMAKAAEEIQCLLPNEITRGRMTEILLAVASSPTNHDNAFFKLKDQLGQELDKLQKLRPSVPHLLMFPLEPRGLIPQHYNHACPNPDEQPALRRLPTLSAVMGGVRKSSKAYKDAMELGDARQVPNICLPQQIGSNTLQTFCNSSMGHNLFAPMFKKTWPSRTACPSVVVAALAAPALPLVCT